MSRTLRVWLLVVFAASGFSGLVYESLWTHYLKLFLGHASYAQTLVLAIFMGGTALGAWLASRYSARIRDLLLAYAMAEAAIGAAALWFHEAFVGATGLAYDRILPALSSPASAGMVRWALSAALVLPQCLLLGATFPLVAGGMLRRFPAAPGRSIALLYFANSLGAVAGVLASGFVLVRVAGLPGTIRIAGVVNLLVAAAAVGIARRLRAAEPTADAAELPRPRIDRRFALLLAVALLTGASSFMYEVGWIRMLGLVLGTSTHAFELMLGAFILGLALGSLWIRGRVDRVRSPVRWLGRVHLAMGLLALATLPAYGRSFEVMKWLMGVLERTDRGYLLFNVASGGIAMAIMIPATFCAGMTLPLLTFTLLSERRGERSIGAVYAANTVGAILGVVLAIHGMPLLGVKGVVTSGAAIDLALGVALLLGATASHRLRSAGVTGAVAVAALAWATLGVRLDPYAMASGVYRHGKLIDREGAHVLSHRDGKTATVSLVSDSTGKTGIATNGKIDAAIMMEPGRAPSADEATMVLLGALPLALHPDARAAACIGFGSGMTTHTLLASPRLEVVDTVEIEPFMVETARWFRPRVERAYADPRSRIHVEDAKTFFASRRKAYDLIVSEPSNPWVSGVASLFSQEFYSVLRRHLAPRGLLVQWIQVYEIDVGLVLSILKALDSQFQDWAVFAASDVDLVVIAADAPGTIGSLREGTLQDAPEVADALGRVDLRGVQDLEVRRIGDRRSWGAFVRSAPIAANSDFHPVVDQAAARVRFLGKAATPLLDLTRFPFAALEILSGPRPSWTETKVTPTQFVLARRAAAAVATRERLLGSSTVEPASRDGAAVPGEVERWMASCERGDAGPFPLAAFHDVVVMLVPTLRPEELAPIWARLSRERCADALDPASRRWLTLLSAAGERDPGAMASTAEAILADRDALRSWQVRYALAAGMLGSIAQGDRAGARRLWAQHAGSLRGDPVLLLELLVAESSAP